MRSLPRPPLGVVMPARRAAGEPRQAGSGRCLARELQGAHCRECHAPAEEPFGVHVACCGRPLSARFDRLEIIRLPQDQVDRVKGGVTAGTCEVYGRSMTGTQRPVVIVGSHPDVPLAVATMARRASQRVSGLRDHFAASSLPTRSASWRLPGWQANVRVGQFGPTRAPGGDVVGAAPTRDLLLPSQHRRHRSRPAANWAFGPMGAIP